LVRHDFISYTFLKHIHIRDVGEGRAEGFLIGQFLICANLFAAPLWLTGLVAFFRSSRYRMLAWMYLVPVAIFFFSKGRHYYTAGVYPMLIAMGSATAERWVNSLPRWGRRSLEFVLFQGIIVCGAYFVAGWVPLASSGPLRNFAFDHSDDLREEIGWDGLVRNVAHIRDSLPAEQQGSVGVLVGNYGEQGAIEMLGPAYHLPLPISMTNSAWLRGYPAEPPKTLIVVGFSAEAANRGFTRCRLAGHNGNQEGVKNEESQYHPDIFVCASPRLPWPEFWKKYQSFG
jgi:hypothetical protein